MAVSKRLRYEVLRRDNFTCRYCGRGAPEVKLQVDHVVPEALGGRDEPTNLVTACVDCNGGKTSVPPDAPIVEDVRQDALRWSRALQEAARIRRADRERLLRVGDEFHEYWHSFGYGVGDDREPLPLDVDWREAVERFFSAGLDMADLESAVRISMGNNKVLPDGKFRYFAGVCWQIVGDLQETAAQLVDALGEPAAAPAPRPPVPLAGPQSAEARAQIRAAIQEARAKARRTKD
jgi:hypothetical protein